MIKKNIAFQLKPGISCETEWYFPPKNWNNSLCTNVLFSNNKIYGEPKNFTTQTISFVQQLTVFRG